MTDKIHTGWHRVMECVEREDIHISQGSGVGMAAEPALMMDEWRGENLQDMLGLIPHMPHFFIERELIEMVTQEDSLASLSDMHTAGVLRLPFEIAMVEYPGFQDVAVSNFCILRDRTDAVREICPEAPFLATHMTLCHDVEGDYLILPPSVSYLQWVPPDEERPDPWIRSMTTTAPWLGASPRVTQMVQNSQNRMAGVPARALMTSMLIMGAAGTRREVIEPRRLNKRRAEQGRPLIPRHTVIRIGHVYNPSGRAEEYVPRRSPRPHLRRGHLRHVATGPGRTGRRVVYIPPRLVSWHPEDTAQPRIPEYEVKL